MPGILPDWLLLTPLLGAAVAGVDRRADPTTGDAPFRSELFSRERLVEHARALAAEQQVAPGERRGRPLLRPLNESARVLAATYHQIATATRRQAAITPAAEWLLDNFHIVEEQIADIRKHLPRRYYAELPKLQGGPLAGYPRVYALALELIAHSDGALDAQSLADFVRAYQEVAPLSTGELWAVAIMLRVGLVENLRRLTAPLEAQRRERAEADAWAERLIEAATNQPGEVVVILGEMARKKPAPGNTYLVRLLQRLRGRGPAVQPVLGWIDQQLAERGLHAEELIRLETQTQAADQVSVSNTITSFRLLSTIDWTAFFENASRVEAILRQDPAGVHPRSDFNTRDACRHVVEQIARGTRCDEIDVARQALQAAERGAEHAEGFDGSELPATLRPPSPAGGHIGYYLVGAGRPDLERELGCRPSLRTRLYRAVTGHPTGFYLGSIGLALAGLLALVALYSRHHGAPGWLLALSLLFALLPASDLAVAVVNRIVTLVLPPRLLPKCDFSTGIPDECRTLVVVPCMLTSEESIAQLLERLEVHYLANPDRNLHFALLTDFPDAPAEDMPGDVDLLHHAIVGILALNERSEGPNTYHRFFLFHRSRRWNPSQGCWMGWERKRGKLVELNRLLRGAEDTSYSLCIGDRDALRGVRYVLTLDADTQLPPEAARRLIGTLAHPLNRPVVDSKQGRVVDGYGILQPRVSIALPSAARTRFTRVFSGNAGVDPYTTAVSDVYQDLFGEGIFVGKGLYDLDTFQEVLEGRVADNTLLSHDLFEGNFARCGLVTDIELFDDYPARYNTYSARQHRWVRGDWQLLPWLLPRVRQADGQRVPNPLPPVARWKIVDNLRRSLVAPALVLLLAAGWLFLPGSPAAWTVAALLVTAFPIYAHLASALFVDPRGVPWTSYFWGIGYDAWTNLEQTALSLTFLAHQAWSMLDAIARTLGRMAVTHRNLMEWQTAADTEGRLGASLAGFWQWLWPAPAIALALGAAVGFRHPDALPVAAPFLLAWLVSPVVAWWVSRPLRRAPEAVTDADRALLRVVARKTWAFFEDVVTETDHWLPPDNYQPDRDPALTHRTSPTNIGLLLLATVSARDLGHLGLLETADRLERTLWNVAALERFHGHLYNWYDTAEARPIPPFYISSVDSGNLAGHLIALEQACADLVHEPLFGAPTVAGLEDTLAALREPLPEATLRQPEFQAVVRALPALQEPGPHSIPEWCAQLAGFRAAAEALAARLEAVHGAPAGALSTPNSAPALGWAQRLRAAAREQDRDATTLFPWAALLTTPPPDRGGWRGESDASGSTPDRSPARRDPPPEAFAELRAHPLSLADLPDAMDRALGELEQLAALQRGEGWGDRLAAGTEGAEGSGDPASADPSPIAPLPARSEAWLEELRAAFTASRERATMLLQRYHGLGELAGQLVQEMDFRFLYDPQRDLFAVGYDVGESRLDRYHYDLLASECRLASLVAIAKRDVPQKHWFRMGRSLTAGGRVPSGRSLALVSWGGTMFEYLMPLLVMRAYEGTLLAQTLPAVVDRQQRFAAREGVPWGISESGFNARDPAMNYQYRAFGVPGLGLRPDLSEDLVVAPYATLLALPVAPRAAVRNLQALAREGGADGYGYYEAIDYTPSRLQRGQRCEVVRSYMAHHQGMALVSVANYLLGNRMQERFHRDPMIKAVELLLQERNPREVAVTHPQTQEVLSAKMVEREIATTYRTFDTPHTANPRVVLLSNGRYSVMVTNAGGSASSWRSPAGQHHAVTRWREDVTRDPWGMFFYLRDCRSGETWSAAYQPLRGPVRDYEVVFTEDKAEFRRRVSGIVTHLEIAVSPEDDVDLRRLSITNTTEYVRELEVTSYAEVVIAPAAADQAHAAFSNLFVETEYVPARSALLATRRPRAANQERVWGVHVLASPAGTLGDEGTGDAITPSPLPAAPPSPPREAVEFETDRSRFLGRGRTPADPLALQGERPLSGTVGPVLDPIFSLRRRVTVAPHATVQLTFATGMAGSRAEALHLAERYHDPRAAARAFELAWTHAQVQLRHLGLSPDQAHLCQRLASRVLYVDSFVRPPAEALARNTQTQSGLWAFGISGDVPIVLAQVGSSEHLELVRQLLVAHEYLRLKGLAFDLVFMNEHPPSYLQTFEQLLQDAARDAGAYFDRPGGVFIRRAELIPEAGRNLIQFVARAVFNGWAGSLADQLDWRPERKEPPVEFRPARAPFPATPLQLVVPDRQFDNGFGGFSADGREYLVVLTGHDWTPAPWTNVIANERFGFLASEAGSGFTWSENSRENRLTPWSNDPVSDPPGEAVYLRHEETGRVWSVTPLPAREATVYVTRHGFGYTSYQRGGHGLEQELLLFAAPDEPIKFYRLRLKNVTDRPLPLSATFYAEWVLGVTREQTGPYVATSLDAETGTLLARNTYNGEFAHRVAFADVDQPQRTWTADRAEFLGRNGSLARPRGLRRVDLAGAVGGDLDPCAAIQVRTALQPGESREVVFMLGEGADLEEVRGLVRKYRHPSAVDAALAAAKTRWETVLDAVRVETPDPQFDLLLNGWLLYQTLACRIWGRSAFYQSGGAFGFRDQLQDVMALVTSRPDLTRAQLLLHASRQFVEGDVQHWWHPPTGRGIRTRFSDDLLWLPYVTAHYARATGDLGVLNEHAPFLHGRPLAEGEDEYYDLPTVTEETATLYEHCLRAIDRGLTRGPHGLPLMGSGDWNDGMNRVGHEGRGESVWVAWFLCALLRDFLPVCEARGDAERAAQFRAEIDRLRQAVEQEAWDGEWYRRAYFDDGTPLGSAANEECRIDSLAQTWAVISGAGDPQRSRQAMAAVEKFLVREEDGLILLFTPPFDKSPLDPGYIKGYVPGVRENGGQYTHAALWVVLATALLGEGDRAFQLYSLLNPIRHGDTPERIDTYRVEPYVIAADVYGAQPHTGRGGWTWYTGSASWMYRVGLEAILGFHLEGDHLTVAPCIPAAWPGFRLAYTRGETRYQVTVENPHHVQRGVASVELDGTLLPDGRVPLADDGNEHQVRVVMGGGNTG